MPSPAESPAWTEQDLRDDPHQHEAKADKVRRMFAAIAPAYDLNNRLHSFGRDQAWRKAAVRAARIQPGHRVLDCACGTGDLTRALADAGPAHVIGLDFTPEMLDIARTKRLGAARTPGCEIIEYLEGDAMHLPFENHRFDALTIAFGIRNVTDPVRALREFRRVLKPGGRLVVLEFTEPKNPLIRWGNNLYTRVIMPRTATAISRDRSGAYKYLPRSIERFLDREAMAGALREAGFSSVAVQPLTFGVCALYSGDA